MWIGNLSQTELKQKLIGVITGHTYAVCRFVTVQFDYPPGMAAAVAGNEMNKITIQSKIKLVS